LSERYPLLFLFRPLLRKVSSSSGLELLFFLSFFVSFDPLPDTLPQFLFELWPFTYSWLLIPASHKRVLRVLFSFLFTFFSSPTKVQKPFYVHLVVGMRLESRDSRLQSPPSSVCNSLVSTSVFNVQAPVIILPGQMFRSAQLTRSEKSPPPPGARVRRCCCGGPKNFAEVPSFA